MATYSEVVIKFTNDWVVDDKLVYASSNEVQSLLYTWVTTRSTTREVTAGTPTANPGETSAINFKAAWDLDQPTGYVTAVQNTNEVLIQSEDPTEVFYFWGVFSGSGTATFTITNYSATPPVTEVNKGLIRSPYYVTTPMESDTTTSVTIDVYIWDDDLSSLPASATYQLTRKRPTVDYSEFNTNIADIVSIDVSLPTLSVTGSTGLIDASCVEWVKYTAVYTDSVQTVGNIEGAFAALDGYGLYSEGVNFEPSDVLTDCANRKVSRNGWIVFPFISDGTITSIDIDSDGTDINETETVTTSNEADHFVQYLLVDVSTAANDSYITITVGADTYVYEIIDECRYEPKQILFKNRYGVFEFVTMFKKFSESITVENQEFNNNYVLQGTYSTTKHQYQKIDVFAKESFTVNSGYVNEAENELYKQLLVSDQVYLWDGTNYIPINVRTKDNVFKTRVNDSLVNYTIEFDYAYNYIQNV